ncbi:MAG: hypothetical protein GY796_25340 [Chloroflexi bacterium]|nr:hypothetical protein [Chloroflexota bacterium]
MTPIHELDAPNRPSKETLVESNSALVEAVNNLNETLGAMGLTEAKIIVDVDQLAAEGGFLQVEDIDKAFIN